MTERTHVPGCTCIQLNYTQTTANLKLYSMFSPEDDQRVFDERSGFQLAQEEADAL